MKVVRKIMGFLRWLLGVLGILVSVKRDGGCPKPKDEGDDETIEEPSDEEQDNRCTR